MYFYFAIVFKKKKKNIMHNCEKNSKKLLNLTRKLYATVLYAV